MTAYSNIAAAQAARECRPWLDRAMRVAAVSAGGRPSELFEDIRFKQYVHARWAVMLALKDRWPELKNSGVGLLLHRDPSTVHHGLDQGRYLRERDPSFARLCERVAAA